MIEKFKEAYGIIHISWRDVVEGFFVGVFAIVFVIVVRSMAKQKEYMLVKHSQKTFYISKNVYKLISINKGWSIFIYAVLGEEGSQDLYHVVLLRNGKPFITDRFVQKDVFLKLYPSYEVVYLD